MLIHSFRSPKCWSLLALTLIAVGCGQHGERQGSGAINAPAGDPAGAITEPVLSAEMPLAEFLQEQLSLTASVDNALRGHIISCMAAVGFQMDAAMAPAGFVAPNAASTRYGLTDLDRANARGYHSGEGGGSQVQTASPDSDQPGYLAALLGDGPIASRGISDLNDVEELVATVGGGCTGEATVTVFGNADSYFAFREIFNVMEDVANRSWEQVQDSPEFRTLDADWAECMATVGVTDYSNPVEPLQQVWDDTNVTTREVTIARADVTCKNEVDYVQRASALEGAVQERLLSTHPMLVQNFVAVRDAVTARLAG